MTKFMAWLIAALTLSTLARGLDYVTGDPSSPPDTEFIAFPATMWGSAFLLSSALLIAGLVFSQYRLLILGAMMSSAIYLLLGWEMFDRYVLTPPVDDWRYAVDFVSRAAIWAGIAGVLAIRHSVSRHFEKERKEQDDRVA